MASRRFPRQTPSPTKKPSPSGPRCAMVSVMARTSSASPKPTVPAMPHISRSRRRPASLGLPEPGLEVVHHPRGHVDLLGQQLLACPRAEGAGVVGQQLLCGRDGLVEPVLGEVAHEAVATLLVVGVAPAR